MRRLLVLSLVACATILVSPPHAPACQRSESPTPNGVLCCCTTSGGGNCCAEVSFCGGFVPGCFCQ